MTKVEFDFSQNDGPDHGTVTFTPTRRRRHDRSISTPEPFAVNLPADGRFTAELAPTPPSWLWRITMQINEGMWETNYYYIPDQHFPIPFAYLHPVDPSTVQVGLNPEPAWWAYLDGVKADARFIGDALFRSKTKLAELDRIAGELDRIAGEIDQAGDDALEVISGVVAETIVNRDLTRRYRDEAEAFGGTNDNIVKNLISTIGTDSFNYLESRYAVRNRLGVSVKDYGAVGDGVVNDTQAIMDAINAANGEQVWIPVGKYRVALNIVDQDVKLSGPGELIQMAGAPAINIKRTFAGDRTLFSVSERTLGLPSFPQGNQKCTVFNINTRGIKQGDVLFISSEDKYPWSINGNSGVYQAGCYPVLGIGLTMSRTTAVPPRSTVVGASSGATGIVAATTADGDNQHLVFSSVDGVFTNNEAVQINGTSYGNVNNSSYVLTRPGVEDTYSTNPRVRVLSRAKMDLDVAVSSDIADDTYVTVGSATRRHAAIAVHNQLDGRIRAVVNSTYGRGVQLRNATYGITVDVNASDLPNIAQSSEGAYGYGVECFGASEKNTIYVHTRNLRHAFTTNITNNTTWEASTFEIIGTAKDNVVSGRAIDSHSSGFDTHNGAYRTIFKDCTSTLNNGTGRVSTAHAAAFNDRGFGTKFINCYADNCFMGFYSASQILLAPFECRNEFINCHVDNYSNSGFETARSDAQGYTLMVYDNCSAIGNRSEPSDPSYQYGFAINGTSAELHNCKSAVFNGVPFGFRNYETAREITMIGCFTDYTRGRGVPSAIRIDAGSPRLRLIDYTVKSYDDSQYGYVRNSGSGTLVLFTNGVIPIGNAKTLLHASSNPVSTYVTSRVLPE